MNMNDTTWSALQEEIAASTQGAETIDWTQVRKSYFERLWDDSVIDMFPAR